MFQIRIHGRGGQGVVTAAEMLSIAAFLEGKDAQAFPSFGSERMGAPVVAFCRISEKEIREGIVDNGFMLINSPTEVETNLKNVRVRCIGATEIALEQVGRPIPNAVLLGSFAALTGIIKIDSVVKAINTKFSGKIAEKNIKAAQVAYERTLGER